MTRNLVCMALVAAALAGAPAIAAEPVFDDQAFHPQLLPRGTLEYDLAVKRKAIAQQPKPSADPQQIAEGMLACDRIQPLSPATREKCEIRVRQSAAGR